ncbi:hypothetical protein GCM10009104_01060 [Marinobacterium maritimum]|uniref:Uncharacterized protein n=1 Tax=Marinobacterium maritimum TaxID=500162 RepID=A0ABN1I1L9_9GAMM
MAIQFGNAQSYLSIFSKTTQGVDASSRQAAANPLLNTGNTAEKADRTTQISALGQTVAAAEDVYPMDTGKGERNLSLSTYFAGGYSGPGLSLEGLLMPTEKNVRALQNHISKVFPDFLADNGIPEAPDSIRYDSSGNMVLPADYPYADELKTALEQEPAMARALSTTNALSSHLAALKELEPFNEEYAQAQSQAEIDAVIEKYSHLLTDNRRYPEITLLFSDDGKLTIAADGTALA